MNENQRMSTIVVRDVDPSDHRFLRHHSIDIGQSMNSILLGLIREYVAKQQKKPRKNGGAFQAADDMMDDSPKK